MFYAAKLMELIYTLKMTLVAILVMDCGVEVGVLIRRPVEATNHSG